MSIFSKHLKCLKKNFASDRKSLACDSLLQLGPHDVGAGHQRQQAFFLPCFFYLYFINDMLISTILHYLFFFSVDKEIKKMPPQNVSHVNFFFSLSAKIIKYTKMPAGCSPQLCAARCGPHPPPPLGTPLSIY